MQLLQVIEQLYFPKKYMTDDNIVLSKIGPFLTTHQRTGEMECKGACKLLE